MGFYDCYFLLIPSLSAHILSFHRCILIHLGLAVYLSHTAAIFIYLCICLVQDGSSVLHLIPLVSCTFSLMTLHVCMFLVNYSQADISSI
jgi:hypothetical protein